MSVGVGTRYDRPPGAGSANLLLDGASTVGTAPGRAATAALHHQVVEQVIATMRERLDEPLALRDLADIASFSPFHFDRLFRRVTGLPPGRFLTVLRMEAARRILLTTRRSVTDVCLEVGYSSIGTFTYQFSEVVGTSPSRLRRLAAQAMHTWETWSESGRQTHPASRSGPSVSGQIDAVDGVPGPIFVGLFRKPVPEGRPLGCTILSDLGPYRIAATSRGPHYLFAASFSASADPVSLLLPDASSVRMATRGEAIEIDDDRDHGPFDLTLRPARAIDPPLLVSLPLLLSERNGHRA